MSKSGLARFVPRGLGALAVLILAASCGTPGSPNATGSAAPSGVSGEEAHLSPLAVEVNGVKLYMAAYEQAVDFIRERLSDNQDSADVERYMLAKNEGLDIIVNDELLYQEATRRGVAVSDDQLAAELERISRNAGGAGVFFSRMEADGFTRYEAIEGLRKRMAVDRFVSDSIANGLRATDEELMEYYNRHLDRFTPQKWVKVQHILVRLPENPDRGQIARARDRAASILANIRAGRLFEEMAEEFSEDEAAARGGHLGLLKRGTAPPEFDAVAFSMAPGSVSEPVRTQQGFHIVKLLERYGDTPVEFEKVKEDCRNAVLRQKQTEAIKGVVDRLRKSARIVSHIQQ